VIIESYIIEILDSLPSLRTVALNCYTKQTLAKVKKLSHITDVKLALQNSGDTWWITAQDVVELVVGRQSLKIIGTNGVRLEGDDVPRIKQAIRKKALPSADVELEIDPNRPGVLASYLVETYLNTGCKIPSWEMASSEADADENESEEGTDNALKLTGAKRKKKCFN
jgi:hypothetical protein